MAFKTNTFNGLNFLKVLKVDKCKHPAVVLLCTFVSEA